MLDEFGNKVHWNTPIEQDGVPMALIHVVSRSNCIECISELQGARGITFEVEPRRQAIDTKQGKHAPLDRIDNDLGTKRKAFNNSGELQAAVSYSIEHGSVPQANVQK
jgi:hypothetical protein